MAKEDIDNRILKWVSYIIDNKIYKSEASYLRILGLPPNKLSDVRNGKTRFTATDIGKILMLSTELNANWIMTGRGNMLFDEDSSYNIGQIDVLRDINKELMSKIDSLNNKVGALETELSSMKKGNAQLGMVADNVDADSYGLVK